MKKLLLLISCIAALFAVPSLTQAQITIAQWTFENLTITNYAPDPAPDVDNSAGAVLVTTLGMTNYASTALGTNDPDVLQGASGDTGTDGITNYTQIWRVRAQNAAGTANGWSSLAPVGAQGAQFSVDTTGYGDIQVAFDWYLTKRGEANLQLQYTDDGVNWSNVPITIPAGQLGTYITLVNNTSGSDANSVKGYYVHAVANSGGQQWFTNLTASITDLAAANNTNFAVRLVNASTGTSCVDGTGAALNNSSGNWRFDNINIAGSPPTPITQWTFENIPITSYVPNPAPSLNNSAGAVLVTTLGMTNWMTPSLGTNDPDVTQGVAGDTSTAANGGNGITNLTHIWRVRAQLAGNGWSSQAPVGTQGAQFNVDTTGFGDIQVAFDWYLTKQGEANLQFEYTDDGINWSNLPVTIPAGQLGSSANFVDNTSGVDPNSVQGYYVNSIANTGGQQWFTNLTVTISDPLAGNNPHFGIRLVNASTGTACVNGVGTALNNSSGNWRFDNILINGITTGSTLAPPTITPSSVATVDAPFTNTFIDNANWRNDISSISVNGTKLTNTAYVVSAGQIVFTPSASPLLQTAGTANISIAATNYSLDLVSQTIGSGAAAKLLVSSQPVAPTGNGGTLVEQPSLAVVDQYGNPSGTGSATFTATPSGGWSFGAGSGVAVLLTNGVCNFTNLSAVSAAAVSGATITFTASGASGLGGLPYTTTNSAAFNIPAPAANGFMPGNIVVFQLDANSANTTFSMLELNPLVANQAVPVNTFPVPATGTNGLRNSTSGSTGRLANSQDGTMVLFSGGLLDDSTVADATTVDPRGAGSFNSFGNYILQTTYVGLGDATANQARSATTIDDSTFWMGDKGGVFTNGENPNNAYIAYSPLNGANVRSLKAYNNNIYALQQSGGTDPIAQVMAIVSPPTSGVQELTELEGFPIDLSVLDFSAVASGVNGTNIDTIYYIDGSNSTSGAIFKFTNSFRIDGSTGEQIWGNAGGSQLDYYPTGNGGDGLAARANASGGFDLFYTTGNGSTVSNQLVMVHDSAAWNQPINLTATNILYTAQAGQTLKGVAFAPVTVTNGIVIYPIGRLGHTSYAFGGANNGNFSFSFTSGTGGSGSFTVWGTTNITVPLSQWDNLGHPTELPAGTYNFTDPNATNSDGFYRVTSP